MSERSLVRNAADPEQVEHAARKVKDRGTRRALVLREQLSTARGREFVWMELERCGIHDLIAGGDAHDVYQFLGRRSVGLALYLEVQRVPDLFLLMQKEAIERATRQHTEQDAAQTVSTTDTQTMERLGERT